MTLEELAGCVAFSDTVVASVRRQFLPAEALAPSLKLFRETNLGSKYLRAQLAGFLGVEDDWNTVLEVRNNAASKDYRAWTGRLFADVGLSTLLVDEGGSRPRITLEELGNIVPVQLRRVARADNFISDLLADDLGWQAFLERYDAALEDAIADGAIAFKSVIAYRTGLQVDPTSEADAQRNFESTQNAPEPAQKPFRDFLLCRTLDLAREHGIWMHIHTGVGDPEIVYQHANPALLYPLLRSERFRTNKVVLVHGGWPWVGEAAAMVAILPNVYLDVSEGTIFGMANMRQRIMEAIEACPYTKVLYGADGSAPEALWIVARRFKAVLGRVLDDLVAEGFCAQRDVPDIAQAILSGNAVRMYTL